MAKRRVFKKEGDLSPTAAKWSQVIGRPLNVGFSQEKIRGRVSGARSAIAGLGFAAGAISLPPEADNND